MPPAPDHDALSTEDTELIRAWIAQGAKRTAHWAFQTPQRPEIPAVSNPAWVRNPIDAFVLARLDREGLAPSPEADRITLLRRLSLDLTGLPPSLEEVERVSADTSAGWYDALVEWLLASPHYGEHWARHWLDAAQYADSDGFEKDARRQVWAWCYGSSGRSTRTSPTTSLWWSRLREIACRMRRRISAWPRASCATV